MPVPRELWYEIEDEQRSGQALVALALRHKDGSSRRKRRACELLSLYEGLNLDRFSASAYDSASGLTFDFEQPKEGELGTYRQTHNIGARIMDAIDAKIFALEKTKTQFVMSEGGWRVRSAGIKAARFIEGQMSEPQGMFQDLWKLWRHGARLTITATTAAMVFFWSDPKQGKIVAELDDTLNVFAETTGLPYDGYTSIGRITYWDPYKLALRFPEHADAIKAAAVSNEQLMTWRSFYTEEELNGEDQEAMRVPFIQGWRMQVCGGEKNDGIDGVEVGAIPGTTLYKKSYDYDYPPCVRFCPMPQLAGMWGRTILERAMDAIRRYNEVLNSIDTAERLTPKGVVFYDPTVTDPETMAKIKDVVAIPHTGDMSKIPQYRPLDPITPLVLEVLKLHKDAAYDLTGMNEAHATMDLGKGLSGVAIRLIKNEIYEMFSALEDEYQTCVGPESAKQIMRCARELQKQGGFTSVWKGGKDGGWLQEISADVFDVLQDQIYRTMPQTVSGEQNTPSNRVELAQELVQVGIITGEAWAKILQDYNTFGATGNELSQVEEQFVEKQIDMWLHGSIEDAKSRYIAPEVWMDKDLSMTLKIGAAYLQARMDMIQDMKDPEITTRLQFFKDFLSQLGKNQQTRATMAQQVAAPPQQPMAPA